VNVPLCSDILTLIAWALGFLSQAIEILHRNERGRQGKGRAQMVKELREEERRRKMYDASSHLDLDPESAAAEIQRIFRGTQLVYLTYIYLVYMWKREGRGRVSAKGSRTTAVRNDYSHTTPPSNSWSRVVSPRVERAQPDPG
jgi:hypothetical protein